MKVAVLGMWHLGCVTAACLARLGHEVVGLDADAGVISGLTAGRAPIAEPGLDEAIAAGRAAGRLRFTTDIDDAVSGADAVWVAIDTPVDDDDRADVAAVRRATEALFPSLRDGAVVIVSSQVPVGTTRALAEACRAAHPARRAGFACSPENLRLGKALSVFLEPDRVVVGVQDEWTRAHLEPLLASITSRVEWMSIESAEMVKHALNAFLATSVAFANEIATVCEAVGADAAVVARALKSDVRIGPRAYLAPGAAFAGGTLARDVVFLGALGERCPRPLPVLQGVKVSNDAHRDWPVRRVEQVLGGVAGRAVAVWGLTYKPGTDTLRRSSAVTWCRALAAKGARVRAYDPSIREWPLGPRDGDVALCASAIEAVEGAQALIVGTEWPAFREVPAEDVERAAPGLTVVDPARFLAGTLGARPGVRYVTVGSLT